jgi:hypothetical protein
MMLQGIGLALAVSYSVGVAGCILMFWQVNYYYRKAAFEVVLLRGLVRIARLLLAVSMAFLVPLMRAAAAKQPAPMPTPITYYNGGGSWNFGWGRPLCGLVLCAVGLFLDYHPALRWACMAGLLSALVFDTISAFDITQQMTCVQSGRCPLVPGYTLSAISLLRSRDLGACAINTWALLHMAYLSAVIGPCSTKFSYRQLHPGQHNRSGVLRAEMRRSGLLPLRKGKVPAKSKTAATAAAAVDRQGGAVP